MECEKSILLINDIIDETANINERNAFFEHISKCKRCNQQYNIYLRMRNILSTVRFDTDDNFTQDVLSYIKKNPDDNKKKIFNHKRIKYILIILLCIILIIGVFLFFIFKPSFHFLKY